MDGKHLTRRDLNDLLAGVLDGPAEGAVRRHLTACVECRSRHDALRDVMAPLAPTDPVPSPGLRERVLDSYDRMTVRVIDRRPARWRLPRPVLAGLAAAVVLAVATVLYLGQVRQPSPAVMAVAAVDGTVTVNGFPSRQGETVGDGGLIVVAKGSFLALRIPETADILIPGEATLSVRRRGGGLLSGPVGMVIDLKEGTLAALHYKAGKSFICRYRTAEGIVEHRGTAFLLTAGKAGTVVLVKSGRIAIIPHNAAGALEAGEGEKVIAAGSLIKEQLTEEDMERIDQVLLMGKEKRFIPTEAVHRVVTPVTAVIPDEKTAPDKDDGQAAPDEVNDGKKSEKKGFQELKKLKNSGKGPGGMMSVKHRGR